MDSYSVETRCDGKYDIVPEVTQNTIPLKDKGERITLLLKACPQENETLYAQVKHIVHQLSSPDIFYERVLAIDKKEGNYLRQYAEGDLEKLYSVANALIKDGVIDYYIELPDEDIEEINYRWFGLKTGTTHTLEDIPVTPQVYAFEKVKGDYILQMDSDVLIGREDYTHSFLDDMIKALKDNPNAVSVGFNIYKDSNVKFVDYHAPPDGYKPEVRFALIHKSRLLSLLPLPNKISDGKFMLGWYHSLHEVQKKTKVVSLRGGDRRSFYIHPPNYRKACKYAWFIIMDRVEKGIIPEIQKENFDLEGSFYGWTIPKRNEDIVILVVINETSEIHKFFRFFESIRSQDTDEIGIMLINTDPDYAKDKLLWSFLKDKERVTCVHTKIPLTNTEAIYIGVHYFIDNLDSFVMLVNPNDFLVGRNAVSEILERLKMYNSDLLVGKPLNREILESMGHIMIDFINTRDIRSNLYFYPKVFKKSLLESVGQYGFKVKMEVDGNLTNFGKLSKEYAWIEDPENAYMFSVLTEWSKNPIRFDFINYFVGRMVDMDAVKEVYEVLKNKKNQISPRKIIDGRIDFILNLEKIEIDITYDCNLKCVACNRSCTQAPSKEDYMTIEQIREFVRESIELNRKWELINILGGEPTLHPDFLEIVNIILEEYINKFSPDTILQITSNGYSKETREILKKLPKSKNIVVDRYSFKTNRKVEYFTPFNLAPVDTEEYRNSNFSTGCWVTSYCGMGLNKYGYYPCGVVGAMNRVMGYDVGIKSLKNVTVDKLKELLDIFCRYCGNFLDYAKNYGDFIPRCEKRPFKKNIITKTWIGVYSNYHRKRPKLTPIYEG